MIKFINQSILIYTETILRSITFEILFYAASFQFGKKVVLMSLCLFAELSAQSWPYTSELLFAVKIPLNFNSVKMDKLLISINSYILK